jgi:cytochrome c oxidase cbb3-type subunit III
MRRTLILLVLLAACDREERDFQVAPQLSETRLPATMTDLYPGGVPPVSQLKAPYDDNAWAINEGKRLYNWFNCVGCHAHGGGSIGPPLMDEEWIYGSSPEQLYATIVQGRPNGMPAFGARLTTDDVWKLVSYVRAISGLQNKDVRPTRNDEMWYMPSEQRKKPENPRSAVPPRSYD